MVPETPNTDRDTADAPADPELRRLLESSRRVAVVGASSRDGRPANYVPTYLAEHGYEVVGVSPTVAGTQLFGQDAVGSLAELDDEAEPIDIVNVFRRNEQIADHVPEILALATLPKVVWIQLGLRNDEAASALRAAGITVVQDRCIMVEHRRLLGVG